MATELLTIQDRNFDSELRFTATRSSGPGGQHVNKVNTRIELRFNVLQSVLLSDDEKALLLKKLKNKINSEGVLILVSQTTRSQLKNREDVLEKFYILIDKALTIPKTRKPSKPSKGAIIKRLSEKRKQSEKKQDRKLQDEE